MSHWWLLASSFSPPPPSGKWVQAEELLDGLCSLWFVQEQVEAVTAPSCQSFYGEGEVKTDQSESEEGRVALREKAVTQGRASCICWEFESCVFVRAAGALQRRCKESPALCWHCQCPLCWHCRCPLCRQCHHPAMARRAPLWPLAGLRCWLSFTGEKGDL